MSVQTTAAGGTTQAGTTTAGTGGSTQGASQTTQTTQTTGGSADWTSGFSDEMRGYVQNKGWKNVQEVADSYRNFEKLQGVPQDRILKLPESLESEEAQAIWSKLGKPKEAKDYGLKAPEKGGDPKLAEWAADVFHKGNLTTQQAQAVMTAWNERQNAVNLQSAENQKAAATLALTDLKTEWGAAFDKNMNLVDQAGKVLGWDANKLNALKAAVGPKDALKMMLDVANSTTEAPFVNGRPAADGTMDPSQARAQLEELKRDHGFVQKYLAGDFDAKKRMESLQKMASPGDIRLT